MDIYNFIISLFQDATNSFATSLNKALVEVLKVNILMTAIGMIVIITFAVKKLQDGDLFTWKNGVGIILMLIYLGFFNWSVQNPAKYLDGFGFLITYPANILTEHISQANAANIQAGGAGASQSSIGYLIQKTFEAATRITINAMPSFKWHSGFSGSFPAFLAAIVYFICTMIFIIVVLLVILVSELQVMIWKTLAIIMVVLFFIPQTRRMIGSYCIYIIGLTMYKPFVLVMCFFNFKVTDYIITNTPSRNDLLKNPEYIIISVDGAKAEVEILQYLGIGIIACFICVYLVKQVPSFIQTIIGAGGSVGGGIAAAATKGMSIATGGAAGAYIGQKAGAMKSAYQGAGGGIGGIGNTLTSLATSGATNKIGGNQLGQKLNEKLNNTKASSTMNNLVSKGVTAGANTVKNMGSKLKK